jgi:Mg-chelatase subunit ChlD
MSHFECPILKVTMTDPVIAQDGHAYERSAILDWFQRGNDTSPLTREKMGKTLLTNHAMRSELADAGHLVKPLNQKIPTVIDKGTSRRVTLVLDVSGSMSTSVENKQTNEPSFSRLDLIKHAISSIADMMPENDQLAIVIFNDQPQVVLNWTKMDPIGKNYVLDISKNLQAGGGTDIPKGVKAGIDLGGDHTIVLTDGANMVAPPRGTLADYIIGQIRSYPGVIHTVGLGMAEDLDTPTLRAIASNKGGLYCFCPDGSMVGTVFIHLMANICVNEPGASFENRDKFIQTIIDAATLTFNGNKDVALRLVRNTKIDGDPMLNEELVSIDPNKGQVEKAVINWDLWGRHYLFSFIEAHIRCMTTNFKDATLQGYASPNTRAFIDYGEGVFMAIAPPVPSCNNQTRTQYTTTQFATAALDSQGICLYKDAEILTTNNTIKIKDIKKGMTVVTDIGISKVLCLVISPKTDMINPGGFWVSHNHPLKQKNNSDWDHAYKFPHLNEIQKHECYNLVLESGHAISVNEFYATTLGHFRQNSVVYHPYLGTNKIIDDLKKAPGWNEGLVRLQGLLRDNDEYICGIKF